MQLTVDQSQDETSRFRVPYHIVETNIELLPCCLTILFSAYLAEWITWWIELVHGAYIMGDQILVIENLNNVNCSARNPSKLPYLHDIK